jgi:hypothetical protein
LVFDVGENVPFVFCGISEEQKARERTGLSEQERCKRISGVRIQWIPVTRGVGVELEHSAPADVARAAEILDLPVIATELQVVISRDVRNGALVLIEVPISKGCPPTVVVVVSGVPLKMKLGIQAVSLVPRLMFGMPICVAVFSP